jgi:pilus assembly protein Flp/PilA
LEGIEMNGHLFNDEGASLVEYALVLALIALVCIAAMTYFGDSTALSLSRSGSLLSGAGS